MDYTTVKDEMNVPKIFFRPSYLQGSHITIREKFHWQKNLLMPIIYNIIAKNRFLRHDKTAFSGKKVL